MTPLILFIILYFMFRIIFSNRAKFANCKRYCSTAKKSSDNVIPDWYGIPAGVIIIGCAVTGFCTEFAGSCDRENSVFMKVVGGSFKGIGGACYGGMAGFFLGYAWPITVPCFAYDTYAAFREFRQIDQKTHPKTFSRVFQERFCKSPY